MPVPCALIGWLIIGDVMMPTRLPRPKTGLVTRGCYAEALQDCDGGSLSREHYISETLLERFGKGFTVEGLSWLSGPRKITPKALQAKVLCERHNNALSSLDTTIGRFYDVIAAAQKGDNIGCHIFDGEDIERWAMKVLLGLAMSGNLRGRDGRPAKAYALPEQYLRILFAEESMPDGCGFFYVGDPIDDIDAGLLDVSINHYPLDHQNAGEVFGVTIKLLGFQFITSVMARIEVERQRIWYRPGEFRFGKPDRGRIALRWTPPSNVGLVLEFPRFMFGAGL